MILQNGEYEFKEVTGEHALVLICLRYGKEWRDFIGDNAVLALYRYAEELEQKIKDMRAEIQDAIDY